MEPRAHLLGLGLACALGPTLEDSLATLRSGAPSVGRVRLADLDEPLDSAYFRISDGAEPFDPTRLSHLLPPVIEAALNAARLSTSTRRMMPIFVGSSSFAIAQSEHHYAHALRHRPEHAMAMPDAGFGSVADFAARIAGSDAQTRSWHTACTSAANALLAAQRLLAAGHAQHVLVLGVELANRTSLGGFQALQLLADAVRPFDARRAGIVLGEGIGAIVMGRARGNSPWHLADGATNSDLHGVTGAHPEGRVLAAVQQQALQRAGCRAADVRAIKAHATGTPANDTAEARAMHALFLPKLPPLCTLKPWLGHTLGACGVVELALFAAALRDGFIPATPAGTQPDPALDVHPLTSVLPARPGSYLLNQFGFGGNNTSLVLEVD
ncbi:MAG TPA: beta-ketoacyl synthase N-terminal-like domain-containing protein [Rhodanobacteraceae bacterium]